jgi:hypothetical protein
MKVCKGILSALALLLGVIGILLSLVVGASVWVVKGPVTARMAHFYGRVEASLDVAENGLDHARASLTNAAERLESFKEERGKLAQEPRRDNPTRKFMARTMQRKVAPEVGEAQQNLHTAAEAAVVVNSMLDDLSSLPLLSVAGLDTDHLRDMNDRLAQVGPAAWELSRLLGEAEPDAEADVQVSRIEQILRMLREGITDYEVQVRQVRQWAAEVKTGTLYWITPTAILVSSVCFWIALSQICVVSRAWSRLRPSGGNEAGMELRAPH